MKSHNDLIDQLIDILQLEARALDQMQAAMAKNRSAFVSIGAELLVVGLEDLESHWAVLERLEERRETLLEAVRASITEESKFYRRLMKVEKKYDALDLDVANTAKYVKKVNALIRRAQSLARAIERAASRC